MSPRRGRQDLQRHLPDGETRLLGIVGRPLAHSLSPGLHSAVLRRLERNLIYVPFPVTEERLHAFLETAPEMGLLGLNVTTPYKELVARMVAPADVETERTGMVNTVCFGAGGAVGCGTDGAGILEWLDSCGLGARPIGLLGFGATARSLAHRAQALGRDLRWVVTRRPLPVERVLREWGLPGVEVRSWEGLSGPRLRTRRPALAPGAPPGGSAGGCVWVSSLPAAAAPLPGALWPWLPPRSLLLDMNYGEGRTRIREEARAHGIPSADGTGPLCHQAALSLSLWLDQPVAVELFYEALGRSRRSLRPLRPRA